MKFIEYIDISTFSDLQSQCWSGALSRLREIEENDLEDEFMDYLEQEFFDYDDRNYELVELNNFIWFEVDDWIDEHKEYTKEDYDNDQADIYCDEKGLDEDDE